MYPVEHSWTILMLKILQAHLLRAFVANSKIGAIYALYPESFCDKNLAIRKVFTFCDSVYSSMSMRSKRKVPSPLLSKFCFSSQPAVNPTFSMQSDPWYPNISNSKLKLKALGHEINWAHEIDWTHTIPISLSVASFFKELGGTIAPSKVVLGREFSNRMMKN